MVGRGVSRLIWPMSLSSLFFVCLFFSLPLEDSFVYSFFFLLLCVNSESGYPLWPQGFSCIFQLELSTLKFYSSTEKRDFDDDVSHAFLPDFNARDMPR